MTIEQFTKTKNGPTYYSAYHRFGGVLVSVMDIKAKDKEDALAKVKEYLARTIKDMQPEVKWHPASESPGKRRVVIAFTRKDLKRGQYLFNPVRYFQEGIIPAKAEFRDHEGDKILPVAWTYYTDAVRGITAEMLRSSASAARDWWTEENECKQ